MAPIKLYGMMLSANVTRVTTLLNELGLDFDFVDVDLRTGAHKHPDFLKLNPFGQIPALQDGDEVVFESRAINRYIATKYGAALLPTPSAKLEAWLEVESHHFYPPARSLVYELVIKPILGAPTDAAEVDKNAADLAKLLDVYEAHLAAGNKYLAGDAFTLADANHMSYLFMLTKTPKAGLVASRPHVKAWWEEISARPAWAKTVASIPLPPGV
ncbi:glutathione S-transferase 3-like [Triticum dicoccoides]|uniref:glutathione S-transferase 3-like n=1 Tax=Triticum dicoccoides TaxID=85692 RepID=UPI000E7B3A5E|nr:glutathione S-transferase 3-like [Triticum dicoccoides]